MDDYGALIRKAFRDWQDAHDPDTLSWAEVTRQCAKLLKVPETSVAVLKWKDGQQEPTIEEFKALAQVLDVDPCLLAFGARRFHVEHDEGGSSGGTATQRKRKGG